MSKKWLREHKADHFYRQAKKEGYRARSAFKLKQINKRFHVLKRGQMVIDLGCAPGGWLQVMREVVGEEGTVIGVDIKGITPLEGVIFIKGDITSEETIKRIVEIVGGRKLDVLCSDMSPDISGNYSLDQARSIYLCEIALSLSRQLLKRGGACILKVFQGEDFPSFLNSIKKEFLTVKCFTPQASRKASSETYIIAKGFKALT